MELVAGEHLLAAGTASEVALQAWFPLQSDPRGEGIALKRGVMLETLSF